MFRRVLTLAFMLAACGLLLSIPINEHLAKNRALAQASQTDKNLNKLSVPVKLWGVPNRILIPSQAISLAVVIGAHTPTGWTVSSTEANWAQVTAPANNYHGQTLIYGHNNRRVFGPTLNLQPGDLAYVYTTNGHVFKYAFTTSQDVSPTYKNIFNQMAQAGPGLVLMTCDGQDFQYRHFMIFKLVKAA